MEAETRKLVRRDVIPEVAGLGTLDQQISDDEVAELLLRSGGVLTSIQDCREFVIVPMAFGSLLTGLVQSLGTTWGLFKNNRS